MASTHWKQRSGAGAAQFLATEAAGLAWLRVAGGPAIPEVVLVTASRIGMARVPQGPATAAMARDFGRRLALLHAAPAPAFGCPPPEAPGPHGWIGDLPMSYADRPGFVEYWALDRVAFTARLARDRGRLTASQASEIDEVVSDLVAGQIDVGPAAAPARIHGDLWSGNVLWGADSQVWLIDPAAHAGHPESDLAMLALFGAPRLAEILAGYQESASLAAGWRDRVALHQAWPLLVHAALFGGGYGASAVAALRRARG